MHNTYEVSQQFAQAVEQVKEEGFTITRGKGYKTSFPKTKVRIASLCKDLSAATPADSAA